MNIRTMLSIAGACALLVGSAAQAQPAPQTQVELCYSRVFAQVSGVPKALYASDEINCPAVGRNSMQGLVAAGWRIVSVDYESFPIGNGSVQIRYRVLIERSGKP